MRDLGKVLNSIAEHKTDITFLAKLAVEVFPETLTRAIEAEEELDDCQKGLEFIHNQMKKAEALWHENHPDKKLMSPDMTKCFFWTADEVLRLKGKLASLTEENDIQRQAIQNLSTQVAGLRDGLSRISETEACQTELKIKMKQFKMGFAFNREIFEKNNANCKCPKCTADRLLATPDPGEKYRTVVEAAKEFMEFCFPDIEGLVVCDGFPLNCERCEAAKLKQALASLEGSL